MSAWPGSNRKLPFRGKAERKGRAGVIGKKRAVEQQPGMQGMALWEVLSHGGACQESDGVNLLRRSYGERERKAKPNFIPAATAKGGE